MVKESGKGGGLEVVKMRESCGFCKKVFKQTFCRHSNGYKLYPSSSQHLYTCILIHSGNLNRLCSQRERNIVSVQFRVQVHRWCIVHKQPRLWKLSIPVESCWTWDLRHDGATLLLLTYTFWRPPVNRERRSTPHFNQWQTRRFQFSFSQTFRYLVVTIRI